MVHVFSVDSGTAEEMNSGEYAVGGYCEEAAAYLVSGMDDSEYHLSSVAETYVDGAAAEGMSDICDMCGQLLPPLADEHLRQKHIQVKNACSSLSTLMTKLEQFGSYLQTLWKLSLIIARTECAKNPGLLQHCNFSNF